MRGVLSGPVEGTPGERHDGPTAQHPEDIDRDRQDGDGLGEIPAHEADRDDGAILDGKNADHHQECQEDEGLDVSHGKTLPRVCSRRTNLQL